MKIRANLLCLVVTLALGTSGVFASDLPDYPFVFVVGKAHADMPPDIASCSLTVRARDPDAGKAASTVESGLKTVLATLRANKVQPADIESSRIEKQILTDEETVHERATIQGYDIWRQVKFNVRSLASIAPIETALVKAPNIVNTICAFDRSDRSNVEADLTSRALRSAREDAEKLSAPLGRHITAAVAVSRASFESIPESFGLGGGFQDRIDRMFKHSVDDNDLHGDELLVPATIQLSATVNVLFKME